MKTEQMPTNESIELAAQAWCDPTVSDRVMDGDLAIAFARIIDRVRLPDAQQGVVNMGAWRYEQRSDDGEDWVMHWLALIYNNGTEDYYVGRIDDEADAKAICAALNAAGVVPEECKTCK